jgi:hypothetical protein
VLGEDASIHEFIPTNMTAEHTGEFPTRSRLSLPAAQAGLLESVYETETPTVLVTVTGRPLAVSWAADHVPGILVAYYPCQRGGQAVGEVLFGERNPSGKLPVSVPRLTGHPPPVSIGNGNPGYSTRRASHRPTTHSSSSATGRVTPSSNANGWHCRRAIYRRTAR